MSPRKTPCSGATTTPSVDVTQTTGGPDGGRPGASGEQADPRAHGRDDAESAGSNPRRSRPTTPRGCSTPTCKPTCERRGQSVMFRQSHLNDDRRRIYSPCSTHVTQAFGRS